MFSNCNPLSNLTQVIIIDLIGYISIRLENVDKNHEKVGHKYRISISGFFVHFQKNMFFLKKKDLVEIINPRRGVRDSFNNTEVTATMSCVRFFSKVSVCQSCILILPILNNNRFREPLYKQHTI